tara:strand:+ start:105 stop:317 length:213 start_codon:yes stop_codon:yes gene_type:complete
MKIYCVDKENRTKIHSLTIPGFVKFLNRRLTSTNSDKWIRKMYPMKVLYFGFAPKFFITKKEAKDFLIKE